MRKPNHPATTLFAGLHSSEPLPLPPIWLPPPEGAIWKKKGGGSMVQGQVFLKGGGATGTFPT